MLFEKGSLRHDRSALRERRNGMRKSGLIIAYFMVLLCVVFAVGTPPVCADVMIGDKVVVPEGKTVKDAVSFGHDVIVYGTVREDAVAIGGNVIVESGGDIKGDAVSLGGDLELKNGTSVGGDAVTIFGRLIRDYDVHIGGETVSVFGSKFDSSSHHRGRQHIGDKLVRIFVLGPVSGAFGILGIIIGIIFSFLKLVFMIAIAALITHFFPAQVENMAEKCRDSFWKTLLVGLLVVLLIPLVVISLIITLIGIPLVPAVIVFLFLTSLYGTVGVSLWVGKLLPNENNRTLMTNVILGILVIWLIKLVPLVNIIVKIGTGLLAFGAVVTAHFAERRIT